MRVVSFVNYLEFEFEGTMNKNTVALGDVDNDGLNELVLGNENGVVAIFKNDHPKPVCEGTELGMISAVAIGDIFNSGLNALVVISASGLCNIYDFEDTPLSTSGEKVQLQPTHSQRIPSNVKVALVGDVNGDGFSELVVGLTDRVVRTYRWVPGGHEVGGRPSGKLVGLNKWELGEQIGGITFNQCRDGSPSLLVAQPGGTYFTLKVQPPGQDTQLDPFDESCSELLTKMSLDYEPLASGRLRNPNIHTEICGNIRLSKARQGSTSSEPDAADLRSQPVRLSSNELEEYTSNQYQSLSTAQQLKKGDKDKYKGMARDSGNENRENERDVFSEGKREEKEREGDGGSDRMKGGNKGKDESIKEESKKTVNTRTGDSTETRTENDNDSTIKEVGTGLHHGYALATLDGTLMLVQEGKIQWNLQVDHQLFAVCALDVTGDGLDEVVACAWDGNTYIVCEATDCVRFTFHHPVSGFTAGHFGLRGKQVTCLVYVSFGIRVCLYYDLDVAPVVTRSLTYVLEQDPRYRKLLRKIGLENPDPMTLRHLHRYLLYGPVR